MKGLFHLLIIGILAVSLGSCSSGDDIVKEEIPENPSPEEENPENPYPEVRNLLWVDATSNMPRLSNSKDSIAKYVLMAKNAGITDLVVDVRPICSEVLYKSAIAPQLKEWKGFNRTATFDYLQAFIDEAKKNGIYVYASINTFTGGHLYSPFWNQAVSGERKALAIEHPEWISQSYVWDGTKGKIESMWTYYKNGFGSKPCAFLNPVNPEVQKYLLSIIKEICTNYEVRGIILDRGRFDSLESEFSDLTRKAFEEYIGQTITNWPEDVFKWTGKGVKTDGPYYKKWLEFRVSIIYKFFQATKNVVKPTGKELGAYVGAWYASYYNEGVNWGSKTSDYCLSFDWATPQYKNYGYAEELDFITTGCYSGTKAGVENYIRQSQKAINGAIPIAAGLYVDDYISLEKKTAGQGKTAFAECIDAARNGTENVMIFDIVHMNNELNEKPVSPTYWEVLSKELNKK